MKRRIRKKKGLLKDPAFEALKERCFREMEAEMQALEKRAEKAEEPEESA